MTDILEANVAGQLPVSTFECQHDVTTLEEGQEQQENVVEDGNEDTDFENSMNNQETSLKASPLLFYLAKRPQLVSMYNLGM